MAETRSSEKVIVFSCNWQAYSSLESAGIQRLAYSSNVIPVRLACLGAITPALILKAFEGGAAGVYLIGCRDRECQHHTGPESARAVWQQSQSLLGLLGYDPGRLVFESLEAGDGAGFVKGLERVLGSTDGSRSAE